MKAFLCFDLETIKEFEKFFLNFKECLPEMIIVSSSGIGIEKCKFSFPLKTINLHLPYKITKAQFISDDFALEFLEKECLLLSEKENFEWSSLGNCPLVFEVFLFLKNKNPLIQFNNLSYHKEISRGLLEDTLTLSQYWEFLFFLKFSKARSIELFFSCFLIFMLRKKEKLQENVREIDKNILYTLCQEEEKQWTKFVSIIQTFEGFSFSELRKIQQSMKEEKKKNLLLSKIFKISENFPEKTHFLLKEYREYLFFLQTDILKMRIDKKYLGPQV